MIVANPWTPRVRLPLVLLHYWLSSPWLFHATTLWLSGCRQMHVGQTRTKRDDGIGEREDRDRVRIV
jgi:hypothetical protein